MVVFFSAVTQRYGSEPVRVVYHLNSYMPTAKHTSPLPTPKHHKPHYMDARLLRGGQGHLIFPPEILRRKQEDQSLLE